MTKFIEHQLKAQAINRAIRAIQDQELVRRSTESVESIVKRKSFFSFLDDHKEVLFSAIEDAASRKERVLYPATIPGFAAWCDGIFDMSAGGYSHEMLNEWLYASDLKHLFHAEPGGAIIW
jgi:hypothetical protein